MQNLYRQLIETAEDAGFKVISDRRCCELLAWLLEFGGYTEESTHNQKLREDIFTAQKRLNILVGELPNIQLVPLLRACQKDLKDFTEEKTEKPEWLTILEKHYKIRQK